MRIHFSFDPYVQEFVLRIPNNLGNPLVITTLELSLGFSEVGKNRLVLEASHLSTQELLDVTRQIIGFITSERIRYAANRDATDLIRRADDDLRKREKTKRAAARLLKKKIALTDDLGSPQFRRTLKIYQEDPVRLMINLPYVANFSVPGSGKTTMLYAAYSRLRSLGDIEALFIIAPGAAYLSWAEEYEKCFNKKPQIVRLTGPKDRRRRLYDQIEKREIFITTYQTATSDLGELIDLLKKKRFLLVLDESHNIKKFKGGAWASAIQRLAGYAVRRVILTGTPVPNSLLDLWSQFRFLDPDIVGSQPQFQNLIKRSDAEDALRVKLMPYYRRVKKKDLDLPNPLFRSIELKPQPMQKKIYEAIKMATLDELHYASEDKMFLRGLRRAMMIRLMQAASNPSLLFEKSEEFQIPGMMADKMAHSVSASVVEGIKHYSRLEKPAKLIAAEKLARSLLKNRNKKILIWSVWIRNLTTLAKGLRDFNPAVIYGDVPINEEQDPVDNRELRIKRFKTDPRCRVLIANPGACGESISLHDVCHDAIYLDRTFNAGQYMQSLDRIHRVGLDPKAKTNYYLLQVKNTIDETINRRLNEKMRRMTRVLNEDFEIINLATSLDEISDEEGWEQDFAETVRDLRR